MSAIHENERRYRGVSASAASYEEEGVNISTPFVCECGSPACTQECVLSLGSYRALRTRPVLLAAEGHQRAVDVVTGNGPGWCLVDASASLEHQADELSTALERLVSDGIEEATFVIVEAEPERNVYIQFALQDGQVWCEAVHSKYLALEDALTPEQIARLTELGWDRPEHSEQNWFRTFDPATDSFTAIARQALELLPSVYELRAGLPVEIRTSWQGARTGGPVFALDEDEAGSADDELADLVVEALARLGLEGQRSGPQVEVIVRENEHEVVIDFTSLAGTLTCCALYAIAPEDEAVSTSLMLSGRMGLVPYVYVLRPLNAGGQALALLTKLPVPPAHRNVADVARILEVAVPPLVHGHLGLTQAEAELYGEGGA
jgi:hypothetical protein